MESSVPVPKIRPSGWNWAQVRAENQILITSNESKTYCKYVTHIWEMYLKEKENQITIKQLPTRSLYSHFIHIQSIFSHSIYIQSLFPIFTCTIININIMKTET